MRLWMMNFSPKSEHAIFFLLILISCLFIFFMSNIICFYNVQNKLAPACLQNLFTHVSDIHSYNIRSETTKKFYVMSYLLVQLKNSFFPIWIEVRYGMLYLKILESLPVETYLRNKYMKHINIFKQENLYLTSSSILEIIKNLKNCSNPVTSTSVLKYLSFSLSSV